MIKIKLFNYLIILDDNEMTTLSLNNIDDNIISYVTPW